MPPFAVLSREQQIIRGFAAAVTEHGYGNTTIAATASISQHSFYEYFEGKADALEAALDSSGAQMMAASLPAARRAESWRSAVRIALGASCDFLATEPAFARLRTVEVYAAGPEAIAARDRSGTDLLGPAYEDAPDVPEIVAEAILGAIYGVLYEQVRSEGPESLPQIAPPITYLALAPFLGAEEACEVANGDGRGSSDD